MSSRHDILWWWNRCCNVISCPDMYMYVIGMRYLVRTAWCNSVGTKYQAWNGSHWFVISVPCFLLHRGPVDSNVVFSNDVDPLYKCLFDFVEKRFPHDFKLWVSVPFILVTQLFFRLGQSSEVCLAQVYLLCRCLSGFYKVKQFYLFLRQGGGYSFTIIRIDWLSFDCGEPGIREMLPTATGRAGVAGRVTLITP